MLLLVVLVTTWALVAVSKIRSAYADADRARDLLSAFKEDNGGVLSDLRPLTTSPDLTKAELARQSFTTAASKLGSPVLAPLRFVPVAGRQIDVARTLAGSGASLITAVTSTFDEVNGILDRVQSMPPAERIGMRATATKELSGSLSTLASQLADLETGSSEGLIGSLWRARGEFIDNRANLVAAIDDAVTTLDGVHQFLAGPNTYVVLAANNSEMRAGSGMYLQVSSVTMQDGNFTMGPFTASEDLLLPEPAGRFDPELDPIWADFYPTAEWRNVNLTARFDVSARVVTEMWQALGHPAPDGAMAMDVKALQRLLGVVGPVEVPGPDDTMVRLDADNVVSHLLLEQYRQRSEDGRLIDRNERRSNLGDVARAAFDSLNGEDVGLADLLDAFIDMGRGRHLLVWSPDPVQQRAWRALDVSGELTEDDLMVSLINRGGNKLDQFIEISAELDEELVGDSRAVSISLELDNTTPEGLPAYVAGSGLVAGLSPGDYKGYLTLDLPRGAHSVVVRGAELLATAEDGPTQLVVIGVKVARSERSSVEVFFSMHESWSSVTVLPSARVPPVQWRHDGEEWNDHTARTIRLRPAD